MERANRSGRSAQRGATIVGCHCANTEPASGGAVSARIAPDVAPRDEDVKDTRLTEQRCQTGGQTPNKNALLQIWLSPAFPVGAFAYSHGLEWAVHRGWIRDRATLEAWLGDLLTLGSLRNDLVLLAGAWERTRARAFDQLASINELALAFQPSAERLLETRQQGTSFLQTIAAAWPFDGLAELIRILGSDTAYPVAVGIAAAGHAVGHKEVLVSYATAFLTNLVSAAIRLSVIGQTDGQRVIASLWPAIQQAADTALTASTDDLGGAAFRSDIASLAHETQYTRLFRS